MPNVNNLHSSSLRAQPPARTTFSRSPSLPIHREPFLLYILFSRASLSMQMLVPPLFSMLIMGGCWIKNSLVVWRVTSYVQNRCWTREHRACCSWEFDPEARCRRGCNSQPAGAFINNNISSLCPRQQMIGLIKMRFRPFDVSKNKSSCTCHGNVCVCNCKSILKSIIRIVFC